MYLDSGRSDTKTFCISASTMGRESLHSFRPVTNQTNNFRRANRPAKLPRFRAIRSYNTGGKKSDLRLAGAAGIASDCNLPGRFLSIRGRQDSAAADRRGISRLPRRAILIFTRKRAATVHSPDRPLSKHRDSNKLNIIRYQASVLLGDWKRPPRLKTSPDFNRRKISLSIEPARLDRSITKNIFPPPFRLCAVSNLFQPPLRRSARKPTPIFAFNLRTFVREIYWHSDV